MKKKLTQTLLATNLVFAATGYAQTQDATSITEPPTQPQIGRAHV